MLVLTRRIGEEIVIADDIRVMVVALSCQAVRLGITAPPSISVDRKEVHTRRRATNGPPRLIPSKRAAPAAEALASEPTPESRSPFPRPCRKNSRKP
jgi:carbon storage regulator